MLKLLWSLIFSTALAHDAPSGWEYDYECCHNKDCSVVLSQKDGVYYTKYGSAKLDMLTKKKRSQDNDFHACIINNRLICLYSPWQG